MVTRISSDLAICPYCGCEYGDCWEWVKDQKVLTTCDDCGKEFYTEAEYSVVYITKSKEDDTP